jgi:hypothetical protein
VVMEMPYKDPRYHGKGSCSILGKLDPCCFVARYGGGNVCKPKGLTEGAVKVESSASKACRSIPKRQYIAACGPFR